MEITHYTLMRCVATPLLIFSLLVVFTLFYKYILGVLNEKSYKKIYEYLIYLYFLILTLVFISFMLKIYQSKQ